jgi:hypothetical protein
MTTQKDCAQAEMLAGAIALGEANEAQRNSYRAHLAACPRCCAELGGEREIERVMALPADASKAERWAPDLRHVHRRARPQRALQWAAVLGAIAMLIFGVRATQKHVPVTAVPRPPVVASSSQAERAVAALNTQTAPQREHQAESLVFAGTSTMRLDVSVDGRGLPKRCTIIKSSGDRALDQAVCRAALKAKH